MDKRLSKNSVLVANRDFASLEGVKVAKGTELKVIGAEYEWDIVTYILEGLINGENTNIFLYEFQVVKYLSKVKK